MEDLTQKCMELSLQERRILCHALKESFSKGDDAAKRGDFLMRKMEEVIGEPVLLKSRISKFVWARTMVSYQLTIEGFRVCEVGKVVGKDHSTVSILNGKMVEALTHPRMYADVIFVWDKFNEKINAD